MREDWEGKFGSEYTKRNMNVDIDLLYLERFGVTRSALNKEFLGVLDLDIDVLEVGCNQGDMLEYLKRMGFGNLYGVDVNDYALNKAERKGLRVIKADANDLPFMDGAFDLVFTSGLLIHIPPSKLKKVMNEIVRCSGRYVWGYEYYSPKSTEVVYRGNSNMLWKNDFAKLYKKLGLSLVKERRLPYLKEDLVDTMFLMEKR